MDRYLHSGFLDHLAHDRQMLFVSGPRQVGKTTLARALVATTGAGAYLNWDNVDHRQQILAGVAALAQAAGLDQLATARPLLALDELHKYRGWRDLLKGLFDQYETALGVMVTGSASLDVWRRGGDSLMGRYFPFTLHPLSVGERVRTDFSIALDPEPRPVDPDTWAALQRFGGFPEPFLRADSRFHNRWRRLRTEQLLREDIRDLTRIQELDQLELLAQLLTTLVGQLMNQAWLSRQIRVSVDTVRRWLATLESFYYCFPVRPWHRNVARALRKEPKYYLWDWTQATTEGARAENVVASALLKSVQGWTEAGFGDFGLHFVRDKEGHEVDFLVSRDGEAWFLVEVKHSGREPLSPALARFQRQTGAAHAFQVAFDRPFVAADCFSRSDPVIVPAQTLLAQLW